MKNADTIAITNAAITASGLNTREFAKRYGIGERTVHSWKAGTKRPSGLSVMMLEELANKDVTLTPTPGKAQR